MAIPPAKVKINREKFTDLAKKTSDEQLEFFLKRYYFIIASLFISLLIKPAVSFLHWMINGRM